MTKVTDQKIGQQKNDFYVYTWTRPDTGDVFYVGKGKGPRASKTSSRNGHFKRVVDKVRSLGLEPVIAKVAEGLSERAAFDLEVELIAFHGRTANGGTLVNMTDGGEGSSGSVRSDEARRKCSESLLKTLSDPEVRARISAAGLKRYEDPDERRRTGLAVSKRYEDPAEREKMSIPLRGRPKTESHVENVRVALVAAWESEDLRENHRRMRLMKGPLKSNRSGFKGVSFDKSTGKWLAQAEVAGRNKHLGRYHSAEDATKAYDKFVVNFYGDYVFVNFPVEVAANDNAEHCSANEKSAA